MEGQSHPLYSIDRDHLNRMLTIKSPSEQDLVDIARLLMRYEDFQGAKDLKLDMLKLLQIWGLSREKLNNATREIWAKGFRPGSPPDEGVGSSFDTSENSVN